MYKICIHCYWRDRNNYQCFDGHIQYKNRQECSGFCAKDDITAEDTFMLEQAQISYDEYMWRKHEADRIKRIRKS